jgi:hypothetical protein
MTDNMMLLIERVFSILMNRLYVLIKAAEMVNLKVLLLSPLRITIRKTLTLKSPKKTHQGTK